MIVTEKWGKQGKSVASCSKDGNTEQGIGLNLTASSGKSSPLIVVASSNLTYSSAIS